MKPRLIQFLLTLAVIGLVAYSLPGALDHQFAASAIQVSGPKVELPASYSTELYQGRNVHWWARRAVQARKDANKRGRTIRRLRTQLVRSSYTVTPTLAIRVVFGPYSSQALRVAWCESRWYTGATNGQYLGLFQMGSFARGRYGHAGDALGQAQAAYRYFVDSGKDWSPWACKP